MVKIASISPGMTKSHSGRHLRSSRRIQLRPRLEKTTLNGHPHSLGMYWKPPSAPTMVLPFANVIL